jgi:hypothetical protein
MTLRVISALVTVIFLFGCVSHEGTYSPDCIAYAGSNISLSDGQFVWEKFTDAVVVDEDGKIVNQFPGFPMRGSYRIEGQIVYMESAAGDAMEKMYLHTRDNRQYLLTAEQFEAWQKTGKHADCALMLNGDPDD